ncbi:thioredoxin fold domain-containing protein [Vibrio owensii]|uniref:thioredoxin fold domain-containing protein n=1 Tax=Vibrio owensii TaxID=696485 RepID=UPI0018F213D8|nr:thioredoxin fold domain-containing protein [Vibrio owensii]
MKTKLMLIASAMMSVSASATADNELEIAMKNAGVKVVEEVKFAALQNLNLTGYVTEQGLIFFDPDTGVLISETPQILKDGVTRVMTDELNKKLMKMAPGRVVYEAENEKARIEIFTDFTCQWCQSVHKELPNYLAEGVSVEYVLYPRDGATGETARAMTGILQSADPKAALDDAMKGVVDPAYSKLKISQDIVENRRVAGMIGVRGTPAMIIDGVLAGGYIPYAAVTEVAIKAANE